MSRALQLAAQGLYTTTPNPRVGCVLVKDGVVIGAGWHESTGQPHAEINALSDSFTKVGAGGTAQGGLAVTKGATAYVTLEPCSHHGRTPPCTNALIKAGVTRVVAAMQDPNPLVAGQGLAQLASAGIAVSSGLMETEARALNIGFVSRMTRGRPWLRLKVAISLDGKTALNNGVSQWITGPDARRDAHAWRARSCAVLTGFGTVRDDDPRLTVREVATPRQPRPIVVDSRLETPLTAKLLAGGALIFAARPDTEKTSRLTARGAEVLVLPNPAGKVDLSAMLQELGRRGYNEVLVEAGAKLNASLLREGLVDELLIYQAPVLLGDKARGMADLPELMELAGARRLAITDRRMVGTDQRILALLN
ncbi:MAG: bifunctional diaminohydroxyphosphoribosylaminopyrimidine deaminase/5-amino-6-(5-phosphoribosylamino)uracil reductase RibD [Rhodocyclaceae bacterium]|nr:bifunctional diaminohydroxyphosphoribosylaminopyrimidine deaminase/5-amino-6-(5-phosphoribosylamino)uracil reductase RibD [Rhodocyclaceae bacterium]